MMRLIIALVLICSFMGCSTVSFKRTPLVLLGDIDPESLRDEFADKLASSLETVSSIAFYYKYQGFVGIGYTIVDSENETFAVACLNPAGIKLFEVKGTKDSTEDVFFAEQFKKYGDVAKTVADDIRKIYFDRIPEVDASIQKKSREVVFTQPFSEGKIEYIFTGGGKYLVEKRYKEKGRKVWTVYYADYKEKDGKIHPWRILLKHHKHGYSLMVNAKEFSI